MKYIKYTRRENNIYYRRRKRAVGSHTRWGEHNPDALSSYLKGEKEMTAEERKSAEQSKLKDLLCDKIIRKC